jgi:hypothetical protein
MHTNRYQSFLRVSLLVTATVLVFDGGFLSPITKQLSDNTIAYLGAVGSSVFASVPQNEINTLSSQLSEQQRLLDAREAQLREREIATRTYETGGKTDYSTYILSAILFILTVLIVMNYAMDWARVRRFTYEKQVG